MTLTSNDSFAQHGRRRAVRAATGMVALALMVAGCSSGGGKGSPTDSSASAGTPTASSSVNVGEPPVLTVHDGFFPIPQADAKDIPWDQVGPGWFLVDSRASVSIDLNQNQDSQPIPEAVGGLSLVSPDGQWYAARSFKGTGAAYSVHWAPDGVWLLTAAVQSIDAISGGLVRVDLATGASSPIGSPGIENRSFTNAVGGVTLAESYSQDIVGSFLAYQGNAVATPPCVESLGRVQGDLRSFLAPDGFRVVCWGSRSDNKTDVDVVDVRNPTAVTAVDTFRLDPYHYVQLGWLSPESFLMARLDDSGNRDALFAYDLSTQKIANYALPFTPDGAQQVEAYDYGSHAFVTSDWGSSLLGVYRENGDKIATVDAGCDGGGVAAWTISGPNMLVNCGWSRGGHVSIISLETGKVVGTWEEPPGRDISAYGYPQHAS